ncbi:DUF4157 domain-containing protein [Maribellus luteus]|uniref:DUF4157 domain-containing protein n=1 Tax=Maribellus luteus TaxID=2305463 RepID=A0A399SPK7_9BACT|nr:DUF4157 domain-containing protein [Maribellus luteus]RIJ45640.1 DUF4157 domain-containing protein [Maribellus luteus]
MNTFADTTQENKSQSVAKAASQKHDSNESVSQFADNRPETVTQRQLQEMANNSPHTAPAHQLKAMADDHPAQAPMPVQMKENNTGLPDDLKAGIENLSGYPMDDVKVHYHSDKPAQLQAHAYAQGTDIHIASGQEKHLPHEAWHVVQQKQGRVKATMQMKSGVNVNDDAGLEQEADTMGERASKLGSAQKSTDKSAKKPANISDSDVVQAFGLANVVLNIDEESRQPFVDRINFKERVPTTTPGSSQGDHTVAEALIEASIKSLEYNFIPDFLEGLLSLISRNLTGAEQAQHTEETGEARYTIDPGSVYQEIDQIRMQYTEISPFLISQKLSDITTKVWRLLSKRDLTAFDRKEGMTTGGGNGVDEAAAMREIRALEVPEVGWNQQPFIDRVANILAQLIDIKETTMPDENQQKICRRAAEHVGDVLYIQSSDWKNRVAASVYNLKHANVDGKRMAPAPAPPQFNFL